MLVTRQNGQYLLSVKGAKITVTDGKELTIDADKKTTIDWPGEYEVGGITVRALEEGSGIAFVLHAESLGIFFPAPAPLQLAEEEMKEVGDFELMFVSPEEASWTAKEWKRFIEEAEPRVIILRDGGDKAAALKKELGIEAIERTTKLEITQKTLPIDSMRFVSVDD